jgi:hypothetical protein
VKRLFTSVVVVAFLVTACALPDLPVLASGDGGRETPGAPEGGEGSVETEDGAGIDAQSMDARSVDAPGDEVLADEADNGDAETNDDADTGNDDAETADAYLDAQPACGPASCGGCCSRGQCVGGQSVATCGLGGGVCQDCTSTGACSTSGTCVTPSIDAGIGTCVVSQCHNACIPVYQSSCCKSDQTCGCQVILGSKGACN